MADNVVLNPGSGGATMRTLQDAGGLDYPVGVFAYATTVSPGANVVQIVDATHGLPVALLGVGQVAAGVDGSAIYDGTTPLEPKFAKISASSSGDNAVVAAVTGKRIRVLRWGLTAGGDVAAKWRSASTDVTGSRPLTKYASAGGAYCPVGLFQTAPGEALNLNLDAAVAVGGDLTYVEFPDEA